MCAVLGTRKKVIGMSESARSVLKHLYKEGRMTEEQYKKIDSNLKEPQWISCSDMLPKENICDDGYVEPSDYVLVFSDHGAYGVSRYWGNRRTKRRILAVFQIGWIWNGKYRILLHGCHFRNRIRKKATRSDP